MEQNPQENPVQKLRGELRDRIAAGGDPHFPGINPDRLENEDMEMYKKLRDGTLSREELVQWRDGLFATEHERPKANKNEAIVKDHSDRGNFAAWMVNAFGKLELERLENAQS